jgi:hypothetical protein
MQIRYGSDSGNISYVHCAWNLETVDRLPDINLGRFDTKEEAIKERSKYPKDSHGYYLEEPTWESASRVLLNNFLTEQNINTKCKENLNVKSRNH